MKSPTLIYTDIVKIVANTEASLAEANETYLQLIRKGGEGILGLFAIAIQETKQAKEFWTPLESLIVYLGTPGMVRQAWMDQFTASKVLVDAVLARSVSFGLPLKIYSQKLHAVTASLSAAFREAIEKGETVRPVYAMLLPGLTVQERRHILSLLFSHYGRAHRRLREVVTLLQHIGIIDQADLQATATDDILPSPNGRNYLYLESTRDPVDLELALFVL